jgi:putative transcriptional regulator
MSAARSKTLGVCSSFRSPGRERAGASSGPCERIVKARITLRSHRVQALSLPQVDERVIRTTRERLHMSRTASAHRLGVKPRTLERWEQGRSKPNDQAAALILLVRNTPIRFAGLRLWRRRARP